MICNGMVWCALVCYGLLLYVTMWGVMIWSACSVMPHHALVCCVMLWYGMACDVMFVVDGSAQYTIRWPAMLVCVAMLGCRVMICSVMLCHDMACSVNVCYAMLGSVLLWCSMSPSVLSWYDIVLSAMFCHALLWHGIAMLCPVMLWYGRVICCCALLCLWGWLENGMILGNLYIRFSIWYIIFWWSNHFLTFSVAPCWWDNNCNALEKHIFVQGFMQNSRWLTKKTLKKNKY